MSQSSTEYFSSLNYTLANEDTAFEVALLKKHKAKVIVSVCGSGGRALPLLNTNTKTLHCVDLVQEQLYLAELRKAAILALNHTEYLEFMGFPPYQMTAPSRRKELFSELKLSDDVESFFKKYFEERQWKSLLFDGKWEKTFAKISKLVRLIVGKEAWQLFDFDNLSEQSTWMNKKFPWLRWGIVLKIVGNASFFNALLYKGSFVKKNIEENYLDFYKNAYNRAFKQAPARENFFLQLSFLGSLYFPEGNPVEARSKCFNDMKKSLKAGAEVLTIKENLIDYLEKLTPSSVDFVSLSDVPSYFEGEIEAEYMNRIAKALKAGALVVLRSYLRIPANTNLMYFDECTHEFSEEIAQEKTQMYKIQIFRRNKLT
ncbi:MAG: DUF3419 family protein [Proteobacteria bacterium]|nr:DUF3419 family protein [Pseudomonadota bacterium]